MFVFSQSFVSLEENLLGKKISQKIIAASIVVGTTYFLYTLLHTYFSLEYLALLLSLPNTLTLRARRAPLSSWLLLYAHVKRVHPQKFHIDIQISAPLECVSSQRIFIFFLFLCLYSMHTSNSRAHIKYYRLKTWIHKVILGCPTVSFLHA